MEKKVEKTNKQIEASQEKANKVPALEAALKQKATSISKLKMDVVNLEKSHEMQSKQQENNAKLKSSLRDKLNVSYLTIAQLKKEKKEESKKRTTAEQTAARLECNVVDRDTELMASTTTLGAKEETLEKLEVEMKEHLTQAKLIALSHAKFVQDHNRKITDLEKKRKALWNKCGKKDKRVQSLEEALIKFRDVTNAKHHNRKSKATRVRRRLSDAATHAAHSTDEPKLIQFREKSARIDGRAKFTGRAHLATSEINRAAGFPSNRYPEIQKAEGKHLFEGGKSTTVDTHKGGSVCRCDELADILRLQKEMNIVRGKAMCMSIDLSPINKMEVGNVDISVQIEDESGMSHYEVLLPMFCVGSKDGAAVIAKVEELFRALGLEFKNMTVLTADGGSENNGGDRITGLGAKGIMAALCPLAIWVWCGLHVAQICYKKSMDCVPDGYLRGLRETIAFLRRGQNYSKILAHCSSLAGEDNAEFQGSVIHAQLADEIDWKAEVREKRGHKDHKFDHRIPQTPSEIRFASAIPGNNIIIALGQLLPSAICLEWGGGRGDRFSCNSAHKVYSILTDPEWQFWAQTLKVTFTSVIQVMFKELMQDSSFNLPELAAGGMWQRWIQSAHGLLVYDEADPHSQHLQHGIFARAIQLADEAEATKGDSWTSIQLRRGAVKHITDLIHYLS